MSDMQVVTAKMIRPLYPRDLRHSRHCDLRVQWPRAGMRVLVVLVGLLGCQPNGPVVRTGARVDLLDGVGEEAFEQRSEWRNATQDDDKPHLGIGPKQVRIEIV